MACLLAACQPLPLLRFVDKLEARGATVGLLVVDAESGAVVFKHREHARLLPASTMKLVSTYFALDTLGPDYRYQTRARWMGQVVENIFNGNLVMDASGDPSLGSPRFARDEIKTLLDALGPVKEWQGAVIVTGRQGETTHMPGWSMDDRNSEYAAPPTRFVWAENRQEPEAAFNAALRDALAARGVRWSERRLEATITHAEVTLRSPTLGELCFVTNKLSLNLYAERIAQLVVGIEPAMRTLGNVAIADGSGLSRYNLLTAGALVKLLRMGIVSKSAQAWLSGLAISGVDGTMRRRVRADVFAKTGTLAGQRALAGYVVGDDDRPRLFAFLLGNDPGTITESSRFLDELIVLLTTAR